jgi:hypothetical protein
MGAAMIQDEAHQRQHGQGALPILAGELTACVFHQYTRRCLKAHTYGNYHFHW